MPNSKSRYSEHGNALFLILIAVALFAALSYAITSSSRGGGNINREQMQIDISETLQYLAAMDTAVTRLMARGISETELGFSNDVWTDEFGVLFNPDGHNPNCTSNDCEIFHPDGGGMYPKILPSSMDGWYPNGGTQNAPGHGKIQMASVLGVGSSEPELLLVYGFVKPEYCIEINKKLGIIDEGVDDMTLELQDITNYHGDYTMVITDPMGDEFTEIEGQLTFAARATSGGSPYNCRLYHVLLPR